jgi:uncharacterized membrane protein
MTEAPAVAQPIPTPKLSAVNAWLARLMIAGVCLCAALCTTGLVLSLIRGVPRATLKPFAGVAEGFTTPSGVWASALRLEPTGLMALGVLVLIATPVARVAFSLVAFILERDRLYVVITSIVLALLASGMFFGLVD